MSYIINISSFSYHLIYSVSLKTKTKQKLNIYPALVTKNELNELIWRWRNEVTKRRTNELKQKTYSTALLNLIRPCKPVR